MTEDARIAELLASGLFDAGRYLTHYPDVAAAGLDPLLHYLRFGAGEGRWPNRWFDPARYGGADPLLHYIRQGEGEGRRPHRHFDPAWYRSAYDPPAGRCALAHFLAVRGSGRFAPCAALYAAPAPLDQADPFAEYIDAMEATGQDPFPEPGLLAGTGLVDPNYYLLNGSDVHAAGLDPVLHYCHFGWREGRRPNIYFDSDWYVRTNPDLARLRVNPLAHYLHEGERRNRRPAPYFEPDWYRATYRLEPGENALAHFLANRRGQRVSPNRLFDVAWYVGRQGAALGRNRDPFAQYLLAGAVADIDPSPEFDARAYRRRHMGRISRGFRDLVRPERDNPLVHCLAAEYSNAAA